MQYWSQGFVAQNNSMVLGSINGVNGATADTRVAIGTSVPQKQSRGFCQKWGTTQCYFKCSYSNIMEDDAKYYRNVNC
ncbi:MAG: hypothetical protein IPP81_11800 [Chitinophagaceae bacterium]|nr:hypothetical protein [Chitinophagaceae bacterium]